MPGGGGREMEVAGSRSAHNKKDQARQIFGDTEAVLITGFSFSTGRHCIGVTYMISRQLMMIYFWGDSGFYDPKHFKDDPSG